MSGPPYFVSKEVGKGVRLYDPPVPEFAVQRIDVSDFRFEAEWIIVVHLELILGLSLLKLVMLK